MNATINAIWVEKSNEPIDLSDYELSEEPLTGVMSYKPAPRWEKGNFMRVAASADEVVGSPSPRAAAVAASEQGE